MVWGVYSYLLLAVVIVSVSAFTIRDRETIDDEASDRDIKQLRVSVNNGKSSRPLFDSQQWPWSQAGLPKRPKDGPSGEERRPQNGISHHISISKTSDGTKKIDSSIKKNPEKLDGVRKLVAELESQSQTLFRTFFNTKVVEAELYKIPPVFLWGEDYSEKDPIEGVLVTLTDGHKLMITHGDEILGEGESSALLEIEDLTDNWEFVESKTVQYSTLSDYVLISDSRSSSKDAAEKMMELE